MSIQSISVMPFHTLSWIARGLRALLLTLTVIVFGTAGVSLFEALAAEATPPTAQVEALAESDALGGPVLDMVRQTLSPRG